MKYKVRALTVRSISNGNLDVELEFIALSSDNEV